MQHAHQSTSSAHQLWHRRSHPSSVCDLSDYPHRFVAYVISEGNRRLPDPNFRKPTPGSPNGVYLNNGEVKMTLVQPIKNQSRPVWPPSGQWSPRGTHRKQNPGPVPASLFGALSPRADVSLSCCGFKSQGQCWAPRLRLWPQALGCFWPL